MGPVSPLSSEVREPSSLSVPTTALGRGLHVAVGSRVALRRCADPLERSPLVPFRVASAESRVR